MSSFGQGLAVFLSSKKANSIPYFTQHLSTNPNDFHARYYRGLAYAIIGDKPNAIADYKSLVQTSKGAEHSVMKAKLAVLQGQLSPREAVNSLINASSQYPENGFFHAAIGGMLVQELTEYNEAYPYLKNAVKTEHQLTGTANCFLAQVHKKRGEYREAERCFRRALSQHETLTIAHLGLAETLTDAKEAKKHLDRAAQLNRELYNQHVADKSPLKLDINQQNSRKVGSFGGRKYYMPKMYQGKHNDRFWLVKDTAGHAGSQYKVYSESGGFLAFECAIDQYGKIMANKHESMAGHRIRMKDLHLEKNS